MIDKNFLIVLFALWVAVSLLLLVDYLTRRSRSAKVSAPEADQSKTATVAEEDEATTSKAAEQKGRDRTQLEAARTDETVESLDSQEKENVTSGAGKSNNSLVKNRSGGDTKTADSQTLSASNGSPRSEKDTAESADEYPDVEETACAAVTKGSNGSGSRRGIRRRSKRSKAHAAASDSQTESGHRETSETVTSGSNSIAPATIKESADDTDTKASSPEDQSSGIDQSDSQAPNSEPDTPSQDALDMAQQDFPQQDAPQQDQKPLEATSDHGDSPLTVAGLLEDVELPFDLQSVSGGEPDEDRHVLFVSSHSDPAAIGTAFADELERVGFVIEPAGLDEAVAKRNGHTLTLRITPEAGTSDQYPYLDANDVAIETWIL